MAAEIGPFFLPPAGPLTPDMPGRSTVNLADVSQDITALAHAAGVIANDTPQFYLPLPEKLAWFCWSARVEYGGRTVAEVRGWRQTTAIKRRFRAYKAADAKLAAERAGLLDRTEPLA